MIVEDIKNVYTEALKDVYLFPIKGIDDLYEKVELDIPGVKRKIMLAFEIDELEASNKANDLIHWAQSSILEDVKFPVGEDTANKLHALEGVRITGLILTVILTLIVVFFAP